MTNLTYEGLDWKSESSLPSEFYLITKDCSKLKILNLAWVSLQISYSMLQSGKYKAFTVFVLVCDNQHWGKFTILFPPR